MAHSIRSSQATLRRIPKPSSATFSTSSSISLPSPPSSSSSRSTPTKPTQSTRNPTTKPPAALSTQRNAGEARFNYLPHSSPFDPTPPDPQSSSYRLLTAKDLQRNKEPPKRCKMLVREFIDDCLYNPNYGYFSTKVDIFDPDSIRRNRKLEGKKKRLEKEREQLEVLGDRAEGFEFEEFATTAEFEEEVARRYMAFEGLDQGSGTVGKGPGRQVWHTPTELFKVSKIGSYSCLSGQTLAQVLIAINTHSLSSFTSTSTRSSALVWSCISSVPSRNL